MLKQFFFFRLIFIGIGKGAITIYEGQNNTKPTTTYGGWQMVSNGERKKGGKGDVI